MNAHDFRARLRKRQLLLGTMVTLSSPSIFEIIADAGFDWLFVDAEHASLERFIERGYTLITVGVDSLMLGTAARELLNAVMDESIADA